MFEYQLNMAETVGFAIILLLLGRWIKKKVNFFERFFIPAPVIGGTLFSIILLIGHQTESFTFTFNNDIKKPYDLGCEMQKKRTECAIMIQAKLLTEGE